MQLIEWQADSELVQKWASTWKEPHMQAGLDILLKAGLPDDEDKLRPSEVSLEVWNALVNKRREGYFEFYRFIQSLGRLVTPPRELPQPWEKPSTQPENT